MSLWVHDPSHSVSPELVLNWVQNLCPCADCPLHDLVHIVDVNKDSNRRAAIKLRRARGKPGHSASIIIISPLMAISPCATFPSGPGRRFSSSAPKVWLQNSISAAASRQNKRGITIDEFSGMPFFTSIAPPNERNLADRECWIGLFLLCLSHWCNASGNRRWMLGGLGSMQAQNE